MKKIFKFLAAVLGTCLGIGIVVSEDEKSKGKKGWVERHKPYGLYEQKVKRPIDFGMSLFALISLWPMMLVTGIVVGIKQGKPVFFTQERPGLGGKIFIIRKYTTMHSGEGSDEERLTDFGRKLRATSIDELPELLNILKGDMSIVGPRPQLVRDMVFMNDEHRKRHDVRPGLTGLAQVSGRNKVSWEDKLDMDLKYISHITFFGDLKIIFQTVKKVLIKDGVNEEGKATGQDYGDWLLLNGEVSREEYMEKQMYAKELIFGKIERQI